MAKISSSPAFVYFFRVWRWAQEATFMGRLPKSCLWRVLFETAGNNATGCMQDAARLLCLCRKTPPTEGLSTAEQGKEAASHKSQSTQANAWNPKLIPVFTGRRQAADPMHLVASTKRLQKFRFSSVNLEQGLREYAHWFREQVI